MPAESDASQTSLLPGMQTQSKTQTVFCDVALPVPLDLIFTYEAGELDPVVGGRVVVPFGRGAEKRLSGVVTRVHTDAPESRKCKRVLQVLDTLPVLDDNLLALGRWIAQYYLAPIGEVYRTMLPLQAEFRQAFGYRITELGAEALYDSASEGASRRSQKSSEHQMSEYAVLDALSEGELVRQERLRSTTGASREVLRTLQQKKWIVREDLSGVRDARRLVKIVVLRDTPRETLRDTHEIRRERRRGKHPSTSSILPSRRSLTRRSSASSNYCARRRAASASKLYARPEPHRVL